MRRRYVFRGTVQHVGFRYRAITAAGRLGATGWVQNLPDGSVLMEAQGGEETLNKLAAQLSAMKYGRVELSCTEIPETDGEHGFTVKTSY